MHIRLALSIIVLGLAAGTPALAAKVPLPAAIGTALECSLQDGGLITIANRTQIDVPAGSYVEIRSSAGGTITVVAPRGIPTKGRMNVRSSLAGSTCSAQTVMVLSQ
jgi:hypothetical protein